MELVLWIDFRVVPVLRLEFFVAGWKTFHLGFHPQEVIKQRVLLKERLKRCRTSVCFLRQTLNTGCISLERSKSGKTATLLLNNNFEVVTAGFERKVWFEPVLKWVESKAFLINLGQQAQKQNGVTF